MPVCSLPSNEKFIPSSLQPTGHYLQPYTRTMLYSRSCLRLRQLRWPLCQKLRFLTVNSRLFNDSKPFPHKSFTDFSPLNPEISDEDADLDVDFPLYEKENRHDSKILILKPDQTKDVRYERFIKRLRKTDDPGSKKSIQFLRLDNDIDNDSAVESSIMQLKPLSQEISQASYDTIKTSFQDSFSKNQLLNFVVSSDPSKRIQSKSKNKIIDILLKDLWKIKISTNNTPTLDDVLHTEVVNLSDIDLFLLLLHNGLITTHLSKTVYKLTFDSKLDNLILTGSASQIENAKLNLNKCLEGVHREVVDLSMFNKLFLEKFNQPLMDKIGMFTEVYFNKLDDDLYELVALSKAQVKRTKRLLLWYLNYNSHVQNQLVLPSAEVLKSSLMLPFKDDDALPWNDRAKELFTLKYPEIQPSQDLLDAIDKFSDSTLSSQTFSFSVPQRAEEPSTDNQIWNHLSSLGLLEDQPEKPKQTFDPYSVISRAQRDEFYAKLTDFSYRDSIGGLSSDKIDKPIFSIALGDLLFGRDPAGGTTGEIIPHASSVENMSYTFNTNVALANDKALKLPLYHYPNITQSEIDELKVQEPFETAVQLHFLPSPFVEETDGGADNTKYPPIEIWSGLNSSSRIDMDSVRIVTNEGENNVFVSLPESKTDLKLSCHVLGNLIEPSTAEEAEEQAEANTRDILGSTSSRFKQYESQPGIKEFFENSVLNYSGKVRNSVHPHMDVDFDGKTVRYRYVSVSFRRVLLVNYNPTTDPANDRLVQLSIIEGGSLGGRKLEINVVGDEYSPEEFDRMINHALTFVNDL